MIVRDNTKSLICTIVVYRIIKRIITDITYCVWYSTREWIFVAAKVEVLPNEFCFECSSLVAAKVGVLPTETT